MNAQTQLVARAIERGLIVPREKIESEQRAERRRIAKEKQRRQIEVWNLKHRNAFLAQGLTTEGKPRKNRQWPQFKGLTQKEYQRRYMKIWSKRIIPIDAGN